MSKLALWKQSIRRFHDDQRGLEALQTVMILAIAAIALIIIKDKWGDVKLFFTNNMDDVTTWDTSGGQTNQQTPATN